MIKKINSSLESKFTRYNQIKYTGYIAIGTTIVSGFSGMRQIKFPLKHVIHKTSAMISLTSMLWHLGVVKQWDKHFMEYFNIKIKKK